jgi:hypothetical protein
MDEYGALKEEREVAVTVEITTVKPGDATHFPVNGQTCRVHYEAFLSSDGSKFDSSRVRGLPFEFVLGEGHVIPGWDKTLPKMSLVRVHVIPFAFMLFSFIFVLSFSAVLCRPLTRRRRYFSVFPPSHPLCLRLTIFRARLSRRSSHQSWLMGNEDIRLLYHKTKRLRTRSNSSRLTRLSVVRSGVVCTPCRVHGFTKTRVTVRQ